MDSYFSQSCKPLLLFTLILKSFPISGRVLCLFNLSPSFLNTFVTFWSHKMFVSASLVSSLPEPWNQPFLHGVLDFL